MYLVMHPSANILQMAKDSNKKFWIHLVSLTKYTYLHVMDFKLIWRPGVKTIYEHCPLQKAFLKCCNTYEISQNYGTREYDLLFFEMINFIYVALGVDNPNMTNTIITCSVNRGYNQASFYHTKQFIFPVHQKYFDDFLADTKITNMHISNDRSPCQANLHEITDLCTQLNVPQVACAHTHSCGIMNPKYQCQINSISKIFISNTEGSSSYLNFWTTLSPYLNELKVVVFKYDSLCYGCTQQVA